MSETTPLARHLYALATLMTCSLYAGPAQAYRVPSAVCGDLVSYMRDECFAYAKNDKKLCDRTQHVAVCQAILEEGGATRVISGAATLCREVAPSSGSSGGDDGHGHSPSYDHRWCLAMATGVCPEARYLHPVDAKACVAMFPPVVAPAPPVDGLQPDDEENEAEEVSDDGQDDQVTDEAEEETPPSLARPRPMLTTRDPDDLTTIGSGREVRRNYADIDTAELGVLFAASEALNPVFQDLVAKWAATLGGAAKTRPKVKGMDRSVDKASDGTGGVATQRDTLAGTIYFEDLPTMLTAVQSFASVIAEDGATLVRMKNRIDKAHLRDFLCNIRLKEGLVVEVQLHHAAVLAIKQVEGAERAPRLFDGAGEGSGELLDPRGGAIGLREMHTHDAYDYVRILEDLDADLTPSWGQLRAWASEQSGGPGHERMILTRLFLDRTDKLVTALTAMQVGLMGETWKGVSSSEEDLAAYRSLTLIRAVEDQSADQDMKALASFVAGPSVSVSAEEQARKAQELIKTRTSGSPATLRTTLERYIGMLEAQLGRTQEVATKTEVEFVPFTQATELVSVMKRLVATIE